MTNRLSTRKRGPLRLFPLPLGIVLVSVFGCGRLILVNDWEKVPANSMIEVHTHGGYVYEFDNWKVNKDGSILGMRNSGYNRWTSVIIQSDSIAAVYMQDTRAARAMETSVTVAGSVAIAATVVGIVYVIVHLHFFFPGGR